MVDKLVDECNENFDEEVKILDNNENVILAYCTLYCFQYSLQLMLELLPILFTTNTWSRIKKMFLNMIVYQTTI